MKTLIIVLIIGSALLCLQANGRRIILEEGKKEGANNHLIHDSRPGHGVLNNGATDINPNSNAEKSISMNGNPTSGSVPTVDGENEKEASNGSDNENNSSDDEKNNSYGSYGKPSGSSTDTHRFYPDDGLPNPH